MAFVLDPEITHSFEYSRIASTALFTRFRKYLAEDGEEVRRRSWADQEPRSMNANIC